jgi:hypothetical protein
MYFVMHFSPSDLLWIVFFVISFQFLPATAQSPQDVGQLFGDNQIVPDPLPSLLPAFNPTVLLQVSFNNTVIPGQILSQNGTEPDFIPNNH